VTLLNSLRLRSFFVLLLSLALAASSLPPSALAVLDVDGNPAGEVLGRIPEIPMVVSPTGLDTGISQASEVALPEILHGDQGLLLPPSPQNQEGDGVRVNEGLTARLTAPSSLPSPASGEGKIRLPAASENSIRQKSDSRQGRFDFLRGGLKRLSSQLGKAVGKRDISDSKNWLDCFFGEKNQDAEKLNSIQPGAVESKGIWSRLNKQARSFQGNDSSSPNAVSEPPNPGMSSGDSYGGPSYKKMGFLRKILYGLKWALILQGVSRFALYFLSPLLHSTWTLHVPRAYLAVFGRVELLIHSAPVQIVSDLSRHMMLSLSWGLFSSSAMEEIHYRGLVFGLVFVGVAAIAYLLKRSAKGIQYLPDFFGAFKKYLPCSLIHI